MSTELEISSLKQELGHALAANREAVAAFDAALDREARIIDQARKRIAAVAQPKTPALRQVACAAAFALSLVMSLATAPAHASGAASLIRQWNEANTSCRASIGLPVGQRSCKERERLSERLEARGLCYLAYRNSTGGQEETWRPCPDVPDPVEE